MDVQDEQGRQNQDRSYALEVKISPLSRLIQVRNCSQLRKSNDEIEKPDESMADVERSVYV